MLSLIYGLIFSLAAFAGSEFSFTDPAPSSPRPSPGGMTPPAAAPRPPNPLPTPNRPEDSVGKISSAVGDCVATVWGLNTIITANHCVQDKDTGALSGWFRISFTDKFGKPYERRCTKILRHVQALDYAIIECNDIGRNVPVARLSDKPLKYPDPMRIVTFDYHNAARMRISDGYYSHPEWSVEKDFLRPDKTVVNPYGVMMGHENFRGNSGSLTYDAEGRANSLLAAIAVDPKTKVTIKPYKNYMIPIATIRQDLRENAPGLSLLMASANRLPASEEPKAVASEERTPENTPFPKLPQDLGPDESVAYKWNDVTKEWEFQNYVKKLPQAPLKKNQR